MSAPEGEDQNPEKHDVAEQVEDLKGTAADPSGQSGAVPPDVEPNPKN